MTAFFGGIDWVNIQKALWTWVKNGSGLSDQQVTWAQQANAPRVAQPAISMRLEYVDHVGMEWINTEDKHLTISTLAVVAIDPTTERLNIVGHGLVTGDGPVNITSTVTFPTTVTGQLAAQTDYWVIVDDVDHVRLADRFSRAISPSPTAIDITGTGSGTITLTGTSTTVRAGQEIETTLVNLCKARLTLQCYTADAVGLNMAVGVLHNIVARWQLPSQRDTLRAVNVVVLGASKIHSINSHVNNVIFEPRAYIEFELSTVSLVTEDATIIEQTEITNLGVPSTYRVPDNV